MSQDETFEEIRIVGAEEELTHAPDPARPAMYDVYLKLSDAPPTEWAQAFDDEWQHRLYSKKRRARVEGDHIVIHCPPDEIEKDHKTELMAVVAQANQRYRQFAVQKSQRAKQAAEQQAAADQRKKDALSRLKFE